MRRGTKLEREAVKDITEGFRKLIRTKRFKEYKNLQIFTAYRIGMYVVALDPDNESISVKRWWKIEEEDDD